MSTTGTPSPTPPAAALTAAAPVEPSTAGQARGLITGDPDSLRTAAAILAAHSRSHDSISTHLRTVGLSDTDWSGPAATAFRAHTRGRIERHQAASDATRTAAAALLTLADALTHPQPHTAPHPRPGHQPAPGQDPEFLGRARVQALTVGSVRDDLIRACAQLPAPGRALTDPATHPPTPALPSAAHPPAALPPVSARPAPTAPSAPPSPPTTTADPAATGAVPLAPPAGTIAAALTGPPTPRAVPDTASRHPAADHQLASPPPTPPPTSVLPPSCGETVAIVQPGDTLSGIAAQRLGDAHRWPDIADLNPIINEPWLLQPGWHLALPDSRVGSSTEEGGNSASGTDPGTNTSSGSGTGGDLGPTEPDAPTPGSAAGPLAPGDTPAPTPPAPTPTEPTKADQTPPALPGPPVPDRPDHTTPPAPVPAPGPTSTAPTSAPGPADPGPPATPGHTAAPGHTAHSTPAHRPGPDDSIDLGTGLFIGAGVAGAASAAVLLAQRRLNRRYRPGSSSSSGGGGTGGAPAVEVAEVAPVVRRLHYAYRRTHPTTPTSTPPPAPGAPLRPRPVGPVDPPPPARPPRPRPRLHLNLPIGTRNGATVTVDLTAAPALALTGPRTADVARAVLLVLLAGHHTTTGAPLGEVICTTADTAQLLGPHPTTDPAQHNTWTRRAAGLHVVDDLHAALDALDLALAERAAIRPTGTRYPRPVILLATAPRPGTPESTRLHQILTAGHTHRVCAVLLGAWPTPARIHLNPDATVHTTTDTLPHLHHARLFTVPRPDARALLTALADVAPGAPRIPPPAAPPPTADPSSRSIDEDADDESIDPAHTPHSTEHPGSSASDDPTNPNSQPRPATSPPPAGEAEPANGATVAEPTSAPATSEPAAPAPRPAPPRPASPHPEPRTDTDTSAPAATTPALALDVFGRLRLRRASADLDPAADHRDTAQDASTDLIGQISPKPRQLLVYLALHRDGARRDAIINDLWPDATTSDRPAGPLNTTLARLRATLAAITNGTTETAIVGPTDENYRLNPAVFTLDLWRFHDALNAHRDATTDTERASAYRRALTAYRGELAPSIHELWIEAPRQHATRQALDATDGLARLLADTHPTQAVAVLEHALTTIDPTNEALYQLLIQLHQRHGRHAAAARALQSLTTALAAIDTQPTTPTLALFRNASRP